MSSVELKSRIQSIVVLAVRLKDKHTPFKTLAVNYACLFSHNKNEYTQMVDDANKLGKVVKMTPTGLLYRIPALKTIAGDLRLFKVRIPDTTRPELGDADFTLPDFEGFKKEFLGKKGFKLIRRIGYEMVELSDPIFNVRAYFSNPTLEKQLSIK